MIVSWMLYAAAVGLLLTLAARAAETALDLYGRPRRWVWITALAGSVLLPVVTYLWPDAAAGALADGLASAGGSSGVPGSDLPDAAAPGAESRQPAAWIEGPLVPAWVDASVGAAWLLASLTLAGLLTRGWLRIRRGLQRWPTRTILGTELTVAPGLGPAAVGLLVPRIVLPRWSLELSGEDLSLVVAHEGEHVSARDPGLLLAGALGVVLAPWNPAVWWAFRRLRTAVEVDCDRRVLDRDVSPARYGRILLEMTRRRSTGPLALAALGERRGLLERRIRAMRKKSHSHRGVRAVLSTAAALGLLLFACDAPPPAAVDGDAAVHRAEASQQPLADDQLGDTRVSFSSDPEPLVIVDGVVTPDADLEELKELEIHSIEAIKGPAAVAEHGQRAAGGLVWITTKPAAGRGGGAPVGTPGKARDVEDTVGEPTEEIHLRGITMDDPGALTGPDAPLVLVDGVVIEDRSRLPDLVDRHSIESIEVIKGKAAESVYGDRAAGGVIHITTRGSDGS